MASIHRGPRGAGGGGESMEEPCGGKRESVGERERSRLSSATVPPL